MKKKDISTYEIGVDYYGTLPYDVPDSEQLNISHFKRGFGGVPVPLIMAEKFYNKDYFLKMTDYRAHRFASTL